MIDYRLDDEHDALRKTVEDFARREVAPVIGEFYERGEFPYEIVAGMGRMGLFGLPFPEEHGGMGGDYFALCLALEELGRVDSSVAITLEAGVSLGAMPLHRFGTDEQKQRWLPALCAGEHLGAFGLTEPGGGSDAAHVKLAARREGDSYLLDGEKTSISFASWADTALVMARTGTLDQGAHGVSAFYVDLNAPGVSRNRFRDLGSRAIGRGQLFFDSVRVPAENRIGAEGAGFVQVMQGFDFSRSMIGLMCIGAAQQSVDETCKYVAERQAFGGSLARFQGVSFPLAEAAVKLRAARLLCYEALWLKDNGKPHGWISAGAKWWAPELSAQVLHQCLLLHGHLGFSMDLPHQQRMRDVIGLEIGDGTAQIAKLVVARKLLGRDFAP
jgi:cyclohexanecarboxyl-CoA dehydrogenase